MEAVLGPLLPLYARERAAGRPLALGVLVHTAGSTYRKPGALLALAADGDYAGLISGGCLEGDLCEHARAVIATGTARLVRYETRGDDASLFGLGLGCEGAMQILLLRAGPDNDWQPFDYLADALASREPAAIGVVVESSAAQVPLGALALPAWTAANAPPAPLAGPHVIDALRRAATRGENAHVEGDGWRLFVVPLVLAPRLLLLGAGPDALPVVEFASRLHWDVTVADHRPAYAVAAHFPAAARTVLTAAAQIAGAVTLDSYRAAVVMSHHLPSDLAYLRALAGSRVPFVGLLGPPVRRSRLLAELGPLAAALEGRLHAPVGLRLGGRTPEAIALAIISQIHAFLFNVL